MMSKNQTKIYKNMMMNIAEIFDEYPEIQQICYIPELLADARFVVSQIVVRLKFIPELSYLTLKLEKQEMLMIQNISEIIAFECLKLKDLIEVEEEENPEAECRNNDDILKINIIKDLVRDQISQLASSQYINQNFESLIELAESEGEFTNLKKDVKFKSALILLISDPRTINLDNLFMNTLVIIYKQKRQQIEKILVEGCMDLTLSRRNQNILSNIFQQLIQMI